jgi:hypothetical protein
MFMKINYSKRILLLLLGFPVFVSAQVGIGNANPQGALDISTDAATNPTNADGLLIPRVALSATTTATVVTPTESELVYNTATINDVTPGYYYWDSTRWIRLATGNLANNWSTTGNAGTNPATNFIGTTDATDFVTRTNNLERMRILSNGNVGIGTATPGVRMDVFGNIRVNLNNGSFRTFNFGPFSSTILLAGFNGTGGNKPQMRWQYDTSTNFFDEGLNSGGNFAIQANDVDGLVIDTNRNVGIGTSAPTEKLDVNGKTKTTNFQMTNSATSGYVLQSDATGNGSWVNPTALSITEADPQVSSTTTNYIPKWDGTTLVDGQVFDNGTNIGIGTSTPTEKLDVNGKTKTTTLQVTTGATTGYVLQSDATGNGSWVNPTALSITEADPQVSSTTTNYIPKWDGTTLVDGQVFDDGTNIGIGTSAPTEKLDVNGKTKTTNFQMTNSATSGYVLQSDATGNGSWVDPSSLSVAETDPQVSSTTLNYIPKWNGTTLVDGQVFDNGTNIGVGTALPTSKVHIVGDLKIDGGKLPFVNTGESVFIGENAGALDDLTNKRNVFVGYDSGKSNTTGYLNTFLGATSGASNTTGHLNVGIGTVSLFRNTSGTNNVAVGSNTLAYNTTGENNIALGTQSLFYASTTNNNISIGRDSFFNHTSGDGNVAIGIAAGGNNLTGAGNIFIGYNAGSSETGSDKLYIDNSNTSTPLIFGDFATNLLKVNGTLNVNNAYNLPTTAGTANQILQTNGAGSTSWTNNSPALLKTYSATDVLATPLTQNVTGSLIYSQNSGYPVFPDNLPDGFTCTIVNYSNFPNTSNTLTTAKFITVATGTSGASSFTMAPGETVNVYVITNTATLEKNYFIK